MNLDLFKSGRDSCKCVESIDEIFRSLSWTRSTVVESARLSSSDIVMGAVNLQAATWRLEERTQRRRGHQEKSHFQ